MRAKESDDSQSAAQAGWQEPVDEAADGAPSDAPTPAPAPIALAEIGLLPASQPAARAPVLPLLEQTRARSGTAESREAAMAPLHERTLPRSRPANSSELLAGRPPRDAAVAVNRAPSVSRSERPSERPSEQGGLAHEEALAEALSAVSVLSAARAADETLGGGGGPTLASDIVLGQVEAAAAREAAERSEPRQGGGEPLVQRRASEDTATPVLRAHHSSAASAGANNGGARILAALDFALARSADLAARPPPEPVAEGGEASGGGDRDGDGDAGAADAGAADAAAGARRPSVDAAAAAADASAPGKPAPPARGWCDVPLLMLRIAFNLTWALVRTALRELARSVLVLLPSAIGFASHAEEGLSADWQTWLLRPLYAALLGRAVAACLLAVLMSEQATERLPTKLSLLIGAFAGWPAHVVCYLAATAVFYFAELLAATERARWERLRGVDWLLGVNLWLAGLALTRAAVEAASELAFLNLKDGHFQQRVADALLSMRCMRLLFATGRAAHNRAAERRQARAKRAQANARRVARASQEAAAADHSRSRGDAAAVGSASFVNRFSHRTSSRASASKPAKPEAEAPPDNFPELQIVEDSAFIAPLANIAEQLEAVQTALANQTGRFAASIEEAALRAERAFGWLRDEYEAELVQARRTLSPPPVDGDVPVGTLPRARLVRWCARATRRRGKAFEKRLERRLEQLFPNAHVASAEFVGCVEQVYREQRFVGAAVSSFDNLNKIVHRYLVGLWALVLGVCGVFLVDWGASFDDWIVPISSTLVSFSVLLGWLPYETIAGIVYVLASRPYDIGDRVVIANAGNNGEGCEMYTVSHIGLLSTRVISLSGEEHTIQNFVTRKLAVINLQRSRAPVVAIKLQVPARTAGTQITQLIDSVHAYVGSAPQDWTRLESTVISKPDYVSGIIDVHAYVSSAHPSVRDDLVMKAKSRLFMFAHVYMQSAGLEFVAPSQEVSATLVPAAPRRRAPTDAPDEAAAAPRRDDELLAAAGAAVRVPS